MYHLKWDIFFPILFMSRMVFPHALPALVFCVRLAIIEMGIVYYFISDDRFVSVVVWVVH